MKFLIKRPGKRSPKTFAQTPKEVRDTAQKASQLIAFRKEQYTLGGILRLQASHIKKEDLLEAYMDPEKAAGNLDKIIWNPPREPHPFLGCQLMRFRLGEYRVNAQHMRGTRDVVMPKPPNTLRVFLLGGSTAFGSGAPGEKETIAQYMENTLVSFLKPKNISVEVFNAAAANWGTTHERILIENRLFRLAPDIVVSLSGMNDIFFASRGQDTTEVTTSYFNLFLDQINLSMVLAGCRPYNGRPVPQEGMFPLEEMAENILHNLQLAAFCLRQIPCPYLFALQPFLGYGKKDQSTTEKKNLKRSRKIGLGVDENIVFQGCELIENKLTTCKIDNLSFLNLKNIFAEYNETMYLDTVHFGDKGNRIIGEALAEKIITLI